MAKAALEGNVDPKTILSLAEIMHAQEKVRLALIGASKLITQQQEDEQLLEAAWATLNSPKRQHHCDNRREAVIL